MGGPGAGTWAREAFDAAGMDDADGRDQVTSASEDVPSPPPSMRDRIGPVAAASALALVLGQVFSLAQTVALARLLSPTEVGYFAAGSVLTSFVSNFVEGGLRSGLVHREDRLDDAAETVFWATLGTGALMTVLALAAAPLIGLAFDSRTAGLVAASMAGGVLLFSLTNVPEALLQRQFSVRRRLIVGPSVAFTFAVVSVTLAWQGLGVWSLVIGSYASSLTWVVTVWWICDWRPGRGRSTMAMWREMVRFGLPLAMGLFGDQIQKAAQALVTGSALGAAGLGLLRYGERIARIPVGALVEISSISLFPAFSRISADEERLRQGYLRSLGLVVIGASLVAAFLIAVGEPLVVLVLGEKWREAGTVLVAMAGLGLGKSFTTVSEEAIKGAGRTALLNWYTATELVLSMVLLLALVGPFGLMGVALSISGTAILTGLVVMAIARPVVRVSWRQIFAAIAPPMVAALPALGVVAWLEHRVVHAETRGLGAGLGLLSVEGVLFLLLYVIALRLLSPRIARELLALVAEARARLRS